jgi:hypothetical protein
MAIRGLAVNHLPPNKINTNKKSNDPFLKVAPNRPLKQLQEQPETTNTP